MSDGEILFEQRGCVGLVTLNRPRALNALTHAMCLALAAQLDAWRDDGSVRCVVIHGAGERAFCAGGDIRALYESGRAGTRYIYDFYHDEYVLNVAIKRYPKPYIALTGGIVMGGGVGVSVHGSVRVADETTVFAMPETGIGLFPDVGGSYFLPRCPGETGMYLALTGARLKAADLLQAGIATAVTASANRDPLVSMLADGAGLDETLRTFCGGAGPDAPLSARRAEIDRCFSAGSAEAILERLDAEGSAWAHETAQTIRAKSPTATKLAYRQVREGRHLGFEDCMRMEYRMVNRVIAGHDFYEGVRATIIDKDQSPSWSPACLEDVSEADIDAYFAPLGEKELQL